VKSYGQISANGSWDRKVAPVSSGAADIGIGYFLVTKKRSEVVAFTDTLGFGRLEKLVNYYIHNNMNLLR
jgi:ABC-type amino acid transport substrate-binding protein